MTPLEEINAAIEKLTRLRAEHRFVFTGGMSSEDTLSTALLRTIDPMLAILREAAEWLADESIPADFRAIERTHPYLHILALARAINQNGEQR